MLNAIFLEHGYTPVPLPEDLDPLWIQEIAAVYLQPEWNWVAKSWASGDATWARRLVAWIHRYHGDDIGVELNIARDQMGLSDMQIYSLLSRGEGSYKSAALGNSAPIEYTTTNTKHAFSPKPKSIRIMACPHCGSRELPHILRVPELPDGLLCSTCRRPPASKIIFPVEYLLPWVGPNQGKRKIKTAEQDKTRTPAGTQQITFRIPPRRPK
ncbi:hypothetical protein GALL_408130 [mine drainage metagenome]|uniref:Uncharacterized protein n=1 Tax=mine drainage metagenome TaxID=410659 RepID=A0A1J5Q2F5_9ZZZZ